MKQIEGDKRVFAVINTADYNNDGKWAIAAVSLEELGRLGFEAEDIERIESVGIGTALENFEELGVIVIRVA